MVKKQSFTILIFLVMIIGFALRASFFVGSDFPLHDGGLFYVMVQDLLSNRFILPQVTSYNHAGIPFVYPPFALYFIGLLETVSGADRIQLFRIIPLLVSTLTIPAFYLLARDQLKDQWTSLAATIAMALLPMGYKWQILGGGVTRAFGVLFSILALVFVFRFFQSGKWTNALLGSLFCGLTVLSHPECAWFLFYSIGFFVVLEQLTRERKILLRSLLIVMGVILVILPWLFVIIPGQADNLFLPLADSGSEKWADIISLLLLQWSGEILFPILTLFALIGIFPFVKKRQWFLVFWLPLVFLLQGRAPDHRATVPLALLAGTGVKEALRFLAARFSEPVRIQKIAGLVCGLILYALVGSWLSMGSLVKPLSEESINSFEWIKRETPADSKILVISGKTWINDNYSEWMSALTKRQSVSTVQGYEWLPGFTDRVSLYNHLQQEYAKGTGRLIHWMELNNVHADYLILPKWEGVDVSNWYKEPALHWEDVNLFPGVEKVFENESVLIFDLRNVIDP